MAGGLDGFAGVETSAGSGNVLVGEVVRGRVLGYLLKWRASLCEEPGGGPQLLTLSGGRLARAGGCSTGPERASRPLPRAR